MGVTFGLEKRNARRRAEKALAEQILDWVADMQYYAALMDNDRILRYRDEHMQEGGEDNET